MLVCFFIIGLCLSQAKPAVVATIDGAPITVEELQLQLVLRGVPKEPTPRVRAATVENLVERALIQRFLKQRKTDANPDQLAITLVAAKKSLAEQGIPEINEQLLSEHLALPFAWRKHVRRVVTDEQIRQYHADHKRELDGTRLHVSQIFLKYQEGENQTAAPTTREKLAKLREEITAKSKTFAEAAKQASEAPTAKSGGDVGWISPEGGLPEAVTHAAFSLKTGEISDVILSPFGVHLVTVTEDEPGDLSLEDVRPEIFKRLSRELWNETVATERDKADVKIIKPSANGVKARTKSN